MKAESFWARVDTSGGPDACWPWKGTRDSKGYGRLRVGGRGVPERKAHRLAWEFARGPIPLAPGYHGTCVCHGCDNPVCCNPAHLFLGTAADNNADMCRKGRQARHRGEMSGAAKLTDACVRWIFWTYENEGRNATRIAKTIGVSSAAVQLVLARKNWAHV